MRKKKINFLSNKELLKAIHDSKMGYCYILDNKYYLYDIIIREGEEITPELIQEAKENRAKRESQELYNQAVIAWDAVDGARKDKPKQIDHKVEPDIFADDDITVRIMTFDHIPAEKRKKNPKTVSENHTKCNFPPFKHYGKIDGDWKEVVRSHWQGGLDNGHFSLLEGNTSRRLGMMLMKMCEHYGMKGNWRGYSYLEEMKGAALVQLSHVCLYYDESKGNNPFSYYTTILSNSFTGVLNQEKKNQRIRDGLLEQAGSMPSYSRQLDDEADQQRARQATVDKVVEDRKKEGFNYL